jgi:catechol 2,3-dioxygenase-like lactoylglutathione lyase family enzyme
MNAAPSLLGHFHEISVTTRDIRASVEFYEALGFSHCRTGDTWPHPYGVLTDGRLFIGLHQYKFPSPSVTTVRPGVAAAIPAFTALGIELAFAKTGDDCFNEIGFRDPSGQMVTVLEARTYFPTERKPGEASLCGWFEAFSLPATDFDATAAFWERLGYVAHELVESPWLHQPLTGDGLPLALHRPRTLDRPTLVFTADDVRDRIGRLRDLGIVPQADELPRGLTPDTAALLESPEGTPLLIVAADAF